MSHNYDTSSRAEAENNAPEVTSISPKKPKGLLRTVWPVSAFSLGIMIVSALVCITAISGATLIFLEGLIRGDELAKAEALQWACVAAASVVAGWGASLLALSSLIFREKVTHGV